MDSISRAIVREIIQGVLALVILVGGGLMISSNPEYRDLLPAITGLAGGIVGFYYTRNGLKPIDYIRPKDNAVSVAKENKGG